MLSICLGFLKFDSISSQKSISFTFGGTITLGMEWCGVILEPQSPQREKVRMVGWGDEPEAEDSH